MTFDEAFAVVDDDMSNTKGNQTSKLDSRTRQALRPFLFLDGLVSPKPYRRFFSDRLLFSHSKPFFSCHLSRSGRARGGGGRGGGGGGSNSTWHQGLREALTGTRLSDIVARCMSVDDGETFAKMLSRQLEKNQEKQNQKRVSQKDKNKNVRQGCGVWPVEGMPVEKQTRARSTGKANIRMWTFVLPYSDRTCDGMPGCRIDRVDPYRTSTVLQSVAICS